MSYFANKDPMVNHAIAVIYQEFGDVVSLDAVSKDLLLFGRNRLVQTTRSTLMALPTGVYNETYLTSNLITTISSSSVSDTSLMVIEGHTISAGILTFVTQTVTLNGQTQVTLTTPLGRANRMYNDSNTDLIGNIYLYETDTSTAGVPNTGTKVHLMIETGFNNSEKAAAAISNNEYYLLTSMFGDCLEKVATFGILHLERRVAGKVFTNQIDISVNDTNSALHPFKPYLIVPKNSDVRLRVSASAANKDFSGGFEGILLRVV